MQNKPLGRRPGTTKTQVTILAHAQRIFSEHGYEQATIRRVATAAKVDPALVLHYFHDKHRLFLEAMLPDYAAPKLLQQALNAEPDQLAERLVSVIQAVMDDTKSRLTLLGLIRASASEPKAAKVLQAFVEQHIISQLADHLDSKDAALRASLFGTQIVGIFTVKYIGKVEPLASASSKEIAEILLPIVQQIVAPEAGVNSTHS